MKKRLRFRKLGRNTSHRMAMLRNMVTSLIEHERIVTTVAKAKEVQPMADKIITMVKRNTPSLQVQALPFLNDESAAAEGQQQMKPHFNAYRAVNRIVRTPQATAKAVNVLALRYQHREGGYTRVLKLAKRRKGDNAPLALIEYVDRPGEVRAARPPSIFQQNAEDLLIHWLSEIESDDEGEDDDQDEGDDEVMEEVKDKMDTSR